MELAAAFFFFPVKFCHLVTNDNLMQLIQKDFCENYVPKLPDVLKDFFA
jgi:hypothetical protein